MADTAAPPQTPTPRKLFKPSSGRKTPTMVKKLPVRASPSSPQSVRVASGSPESLRKLPPQPSTPSTPPAVSVQQPQQLLQKQQPREQQQQQQQEEEEKEHHVPVAREPHPSSQTTPSKVVSEPPRPLSQNVDHVISSTKLAPLTSITDAASDKKHGDTVTSTAAPVAAPNAVAASDTTRGTSPIGLIDRDFPTPSLEATARELEDDTIVFGDLPDTNKLSHGNTTIDPSPSTVPAQATEKPQDLPQDLPQGANVQEAKDKIVSAAQDRYQYIASTNTDGNTSQTPSSLPETRKTPADIAAYFQRQGNPEMSKFVQELAGVAQLNPEISAADIPKESTGVSKNSKQPEAGSVEGQLNSPEDQLKDANGVDQQPDKISNLADQNDTTLPPNETKPSLGHSRRGSIKRKASDIAADAPKEPSEVKQPVAAKGPVTFKEPTTAVEKPTGIPDANNTEPQTDMASDQPGQKTMPLRRRAANTGNQAQNQPGGEADSDDTKYIDNMGSPAHIERSFEIPLPKAPSPLREGPTPPEKPDLGDIDHLPTTDDLADTTNLRSTDELSDIPEDPPEVMLDPENHSPGSSSSITPIPKIPGIPGMEDSDGVDLVELAEGLVGSTIDDIGNIVDELGEILGHAIGDLPSMVGREVSETGEVYGDDGEVLGRVSENFATPPPVDLSQEAFGHLRVDHKGNILDGDGNIIGQLNQKPNVSSPSTSRNQSPNPGQAKPQTKTKTQQPPPASDKSTKGGKSKVGSPSDICLDVKSTNDGIQLIIRIPTMFSEAHKNCGHANCTN